MVRVLVVEDDARLNQIVCASLPIRRKTRTPKWLSYGFYPAHLLALLALEKFF